MSYDFEMMLVESPAAAPLHATIGPKLAEKGINPQAIERWKQRWPERA